MKTAKHIPTVIKRLVENKPKDILEIRRLGIHTRYIEEGAFRTTYKVRGIPLVLKVPMCDCNPRTEECSRECECVTHSRNEYKTYNKIKSDKKYRALRGFMPKIYYYDDATGIIAMRYYKVLKNTVANIAICDLLNQFFRQTLIIGEDVDIRPANVGADEEDYSDSTFYRIIDLGCIHRMIL